MKTTSLKKLLKESEVTLNSEGLIITIDPSWIVKGEDRLSYTTLVRLIECCREHHWQTDILPRAQGNEVDSICKSLVADFISTIPAGSVVSINYRITDLQKKSYSLRFEVHRTLDQTLCAVFDIVSVFYDPVKGKAVTPPEIIFDYLSCICSHPRVR